MSRFRRWVLHPFLIAAYSVLALLAYNIRETAPIYALRPLLLALLLAGALLLSLRLLLHDWRRAGVAASLWLLLFASYGHIHRVAIAKYGDAALISSHRVFLPVALVLAATGFWLAARAQDLDTWTQALNLVALLLAALALVQITSYEVHASIAATPSARRADLEQQSEPRLSAALDPPDIYYIILDTYPREDALAEVFHYDNSWFVEQMKQRGFRFPDCSQSNYSFTVNSLTSSLNMDFLPNVVPAITPETTDTTILYPRLQHSRARQTLEALGYKTVAFETGYSPTEWKDADYYYAPSQSLARLLSSGLTPFETLVLQSNMGTLAYDFRNYLPSRIRTLLDGAYVAHRNRILFVLDKLEREVPAIPGPKFVFVHILAPHNPFVFGPDGQVLQRTTPFTLNNDRDASSQQDYIRGFRDQVNYLDQRTLDVVDSIISDSKTPPIIIVQGDHGSPRTPAWHMTILNAYYLPAEGADGLYPTFSPVNSFRLILDEYFGASLDLLPDTQCLSDPRSSPFACKPQPDPRPACVALNQP